MCSPNRYRFSRNTFWLPNRYWFSRKLFLNIIEQIGNFQEGALLRTDISAIGLGGCFRSSLLKISDEANAVKKNNLLIWELGLRRLRRFHTAYSVATFCCHWNSVSKERWNFIPFIYRLPLDAFYLSYSFIRLPVNSQTFYKQKTWPSNNLREITTVWKSIFCETLLNIVDSIRWLYH